MATEASWNAASDNPWGVGHPLGPPPLTPPPLAPPPLTPPPTRPSHRKRWVGAVVAGFMVAGVIGYAVGGNGSETDRGTPTTQPSHPAATDTSAPVVPTDNRGTWPDAFENAFIEGFSRGYGSDSEDLAACALNTAEGEYPDWSSLPTQGTTEFQDLMEQMVIDCAEYAP